MDRTKEIIQSAIDVMATLLEIENKRIHFTNGKKAWIYPSESRALKIIGENPGLNITELATKLDITKSRVSRITNQLQKKGLIHKYKDTSNQKDVLLDLTSLGGKLFARAKEGDYRFYDLLTEDINSFSQSEKETILVFLSKLDKVMKEFI